MLYLILAVLMSSSVSIIMRWGEKHVKNNFAMFLANYITCSLIAGFFLMQSGKPLIVQGSESAFAAILGAVGGVLYLSCFVFMKYNITKNGVMLSTVFMKLGVLVPVLMSVIIFREKPTVWQIVGFALSIAAIVIIYLHPKDEKAEKRSRVNASILFLIALLILGGFSESLANIYDKFGDAELKNHYMFCIFACAALLCAIILIIKRKPIGRKDLLFGVMIGVPNYFSTRFLLHALSSVPAVVTYPVYNIGAIVIVGLFGIFVFGEKLNARKAIGFFMIAVSLVLLNI
jgi:Membrane transporters of cations and cationic drugs